MDSGAQLFLEYIQQCVALGIITDAYTQAIVDARPVEIAYQDTGRLELADRSIMPDK